MFRRLLLLFLIVPVIELVLLIKLGDLIGLGPTLLLIVVTALTGAYLLKREGWAAWHRFFQKLNEGGLPGNELADGVIIIVSGALLVTPGVLTDLVGILGLIPATRGPFRRYLYQKVKTGIRLDDRFTVFGPFQQGKVDSREESDWQGRSNTAPRHQGRDSSEPTGF